MQTAAHIDFGTREAVRARSMAYIATDVAPGLTLREHRGARGSGRSSRLRPPRLVARLRERYADDPVGDYETTTGGW